MHVPLDTMPRVAPEGRDDGRDDAVEGLRELCTRRLDAVGFVRVFLDVRSVEAGCVAPRHADAGEVMVQVVGLSVSGEVDVLGFDAGDGGSRDFWCRHLVGLRARGLHGLRVLESDDHPGVGVALGEVFPSVRWHRVTDAPAWVSSRLRRAGESPVLP